MTNAVLPHFRARKSGTLVFISSLSGWFGHPFTGAYASSKFAVEGLVESLARETAHIPGIRTTMIEPGQFRTKLLAPENMLNQVSEIEEYTEKSKETIQSFVDANDKQRGDPVKLVKVVVDLVRGEGVAGSKVAKGGGKLPLRLPLGPDCYEVVKGKCEETLGVLEEWKDVINSTDL